MSDHVQCLTAEHCGVFSIYIYAYESILYNSYLCFVCYRHKIEIEEIIDCALKELNLELQLNSVEEEWSEQVLMATHSDYCTDFCGHTITYACVCACVCVCVCVCERVHACMPAYMRACVCND